jgi:hypothetical protein
MHVYIHTNIHTYKRVRLILIRTNKQTYLHTYIHAYKHKYNHRCQQINYAYDKITHSDFLFQAPFFRFKRTRTFHFYFFCFSGGQIIF